MPKFPELSDSEKHLGMRFPQAQLEAAFELVKPAPHWKGAINALVSRADLDAVGGISVVDSAIGHFCGGGAEAAYEGDSVRFTAPGYWMVIGS